MIDLKISFLKKIFILTVFINLTIGCSSIETNINSFVKDIIKNPERLDSLSVLYPELINEEYLTKTMHDSAFIRKVKVTLLEYFHRNNVCLKKQEISEESVDIFMKRNKINYNLKYIKGYTFKKGNAAIRVFFYNEKDKCYLIYFEDTTFPNE